MAKNNDATRTISFERFRIEVERFKGGLAQLRGGIFEYRGRVLGMKDGAVLVVGGLQFRKWFGKETFIPYVDEEIGILFPSRTLFSLVNNGDVCYIAFPNTSHIYLSVPTNNPAL